MPSAWGYQAVGCRQASTATPTRTLSVSIIPAREDELKELTYRVATACAFRRSGGDGREAARESGRRPCPRGKAKSRSSVLSSSGEPDLRPDPGRPATGNGDRAWSTSTGT